MILYFHGGVYVIGSAATSVPLVGDLARRTGAKAVTLDYRLAPEHPYPAAVEDAQAAYEGLLGQGIDPGQIALAGESAGGGSSSTSVAAVRMSPVSTTFLARKLSANCSCTSAPDSRATRTCRSPKARAAS